jgi:hypothetical protein
LQMKEADLQLDDGIDYATAMIMPRQ